MKSRKVEKHRYYIRNKVRINARVREYEKLTGYGRKWKQNLKKEIFSWYGSACRCCGELCIDFLSLDHILDNGSQERREKGVSRNRGTGMDLYQNIRKQGFANKRIDLQLLCFNCQWGKRLHNGFCPHHPEIDLRIAI